MIRYEPCAACAGTGWQPDTDPPAPCLRRHRLHAARTRRGAARDRGATVVTDRRGEEISTSTDGHWRCNLKLFHIPIQLRQVHEMFSSFG